MVVAHGAPRLAQFSGKLHRDDVLRHDRPAGDHAEAPLVGVRLGGQDDVLQVVAADVEHLPVLFQHGVQVFALEAQARGRRLVGSGVLVFQRRALRMRIAPPGQIVHEQRGEHHQRRIERHWPERELKTHGVDRGVRQHGCQRHRPARRMQAAQREHGNDRHAHRHRPGPYLGPQQLVAGDAHQRRHRVAADHRPWLGQRAARQAKQQHGGGAHGRDQPQAAAAGDEHAEPGRHCQCGQGARAGAQLLGVAGAVRWRKEFLQQGQVGRWH